MLKSEFKASLGNIARYCLKKQRICRAFRVALLLTVLPESVGVGSEKLGLEWRKKTELRSLQKDEHWQVAMQMGNASQRREGCNFVPLGVHSVVSGGHCQSQSAPCSLSPLLVLFPGLRTQQKEGGYTHKLLSARDI